jgi:hypothetical protein
MSNSDMERVSYGERGGGDVIQQVTQEKDGCFYFIFKHGEVEQYTK